MDERTDTPPDRETTAGPNEAESADAIQKRMGLTAYENYRAEDRHECFLISERVSAFLQSQSLLVAGAGLLFSSGYGGRPLLALCLLGCVLSVLSLISISIGCHILRMWHRAMVGEVARAPQCFRIGRQPQPDRYHRWSMDVFSVGMVVCFLLFWIAALIAGLWGGLDTNSAAAATLPAAATSRAVDG